MVNFVDLKKIVPLVMLSIIICLCITNASAASANAKNISAGGAVFIGESGLNITIPMTPPSGTMGAQQLIAWFPSTAQTGATTPEKTIDVTASRTSFYVNPADFATRTGNWYCWATTPGLTVGSAPLAFTVFDPQLDIKVWDLDRSADVTGKSVPIGQPLTFRIETNTYAVAVRPDILKPVTWGTGSLNSYYGIDPQSGGAVAGTQTPEGFVDIRVKTDQGNTHSALYNGSTTLTSSVAIPLTGMFVDKQPWYWGNYTAGTYLLYWNTGCLENGQKVYPPGTYTVTAELNLNSIKDNYKNAGADYTGKTVSESRTITIVSDTVKIVANKDTVTRSKPFAVTVTGKPGTYYWVWVKGTSQMSGLYDDQPPMIALNQLNVFNDTPAVRTYSNFLPEGTTNILTQNVSSQVAQAPFNGTRYWAMIKTSDAGTRVIEFLTSKQTKAQSYTIRVENLSNGEYKTNESAIKVETGTVSISVTGDGSYYLGEEIKFFGTNTESAKTYLFIIGPQLSSIGSQIQSAVPGSNPVTDGDASTFQTVNVNDDGSWQWDWDTSGVTLNSGTFTVYALSEPRDKNHLQNVAYGTISLNIGTPSSIPSAYITLYPGWNFVSTPRTLSVGNNTGAIFSAVDTSDHSIFRYDAGLDTWNVLTSTTVISPLDGIWIYSKDTNTVSLYYNADLLHTPPTKTLYQGWNAVGHSSTSQATASDTLSSLGTKWTTVIGVDASQQMYETAIIRAGSGAYSDSRIMIPTKGYWLYVTEDGTLAAISG